MIVCSNLNPSMISDSLGCKLAASVLIVSTSQHERITILVGDTRIGPMSFRYSNSGVESWEPWFDFGSNAPVLGK
jgi:hypothetical protein